VGFAGASGWAREARAAACCGTGYGLGQRAGKAEQGALVVSLRDAEGYGSFGDDGAFSPASAGSLDRELRVEISGVWKLARAVQVGASLPTIVTFIADGQGQSSTGGGPGDATAFARYDFVAPGGANGWPGIAATFSLTAPTGKPIRSSHDPLTADVTGLGVWELRPGIAIEKTWWTGWTAIGAASVGFRTNYGDSDGASIALAPKASFVVAGGPSFTWGLGVLLGALVESEAAPTRNGVASSNGRSRMAALLIPTWELDAHWSLIGSAEIDLPIAGVGRNNPTNAAFSFGVRRVFLTYE
jgi:hypothetical protein